MSSVPSVGSVAVVLIDLQQSYTRGLWASWMGETKAEHIRQSFTRCANLLVKLKKDVPVLLSRSAIGGYDLDWAEEVGEIVSAKAYPSVLKPDTDILEAAGFAEWLGKVMRSGVSTLMVGGCTTTSCVRVWSSHIQRSFSSRGLQVVVDLSLCGARDCNYVPRCQACLDKYMMYGTDSTCDRCATPGVSTVSPVDNAVEDMRKSGVQVVQQFDWTPFVEK
ncbi:Hypp2042 [Branchiostoma lanceolatum]|uniref:Hypp2042 protein n=1 Tax=Branchiostoma lanceolatum TaxID=7740 RepID=A0A8J9ZS82_BRALA|nr:Hypp2042 [Branchiostoma lanceolatum]